MRRHHWEHTQIYAYLLGTFLNERDNLQLQADADTTRRWNLCFVLGFDDEIRKPFGGTVNYNKRQRRFDFIQYCDCHGWAVRISITSGVYWSAWDHRDFLFRNVPEFYHPEKKLAQWLLHH